jgi:hypothetical protein
MNYVDCTLTLQSDSEISMEFTDEQARTYVFEVTRDPDPVAQLTVERLNEWVNFGLKQQESSQGKNNPVTVDDLKVIGLNLHRILFSDDKIRKTFSEVCTRFNEKYKLDASAREKGLRLRLKLVFDVGAEKLGRLPWEFLFIPAENDPTQGFFFAGERTELILTRHVPHSFNGKAAPERLRILVAVSEPAGEGAISKVDEVLNEIRAIKTAQVTVLNGEKCTVDHLEENLQKLTPHILHFIGHGKNGGLALIKALTDSDYDERDAGKLQARWVTSKQFRGLFTNCHPKPRLVFLHACKGAAATSQDAFNSCARELVYDDIPAVVAMQYSISNPDAGLFAKTFYQELGRGRNIDEAVKSGRLALGKVWPRWEHPRFGTPVVYLQTDEPIVLPLPDENIGAEDKSAISQYSVPKASSPTAFSQQPERSSPAPGTLPVENPTQYDA